MRGRVATAEFVRSVHTVADFVRDDRPEVAFVGRSNVGKSSLLNRLTGREKLARVSQTPGRTQSVNYFLVDGSWWLVDLPGYGYAKASHTDRQKFAALTEGYLEHGAKRSGFALVQLVDGQIGPTSLDEQAYQWFLSLGVRPILVATKIDKLSNGRRRPMLTSIAKTFGLEELPIAVSAKAGDGINDLWKVINAHRLAGSA